jgi:hypothetical protein
MTDPVADLAGDRVWLCGCVGSRGIHLAAEQLGRTRSETKVAGTSPATSDVDELIAYLRREIGAYSRRVAPV